MKIRSGFVSNSSSSSYIVAIPKTFEISEKKLDEMAKNAYNEGPNDLRKIEDAKKRIIKLFNSLKKDGKIDSSDYGCTSFYHIRCMLEDYNFVIDQYCNEPDANDLIFNMGCNRTLKKIKKILEI